MCSAEADRQTDGVIRLTEQQRSRLKEVRRLFHSLGAGQIRPDLMHPLVRHSIVCSGGILKLRSENFQRPPERSEFTG